MSLENEIARDYLLLLLFTGLRRNEAARLRWDPEVDLRLGVIRMPARHTKNTRKLDLPMTDVVRGLFDKRDKDTSGWVFPAGRARSGHIEEPRFALRMVKDMTGIDITPHDLRRTYVTVAESTDISPLALKALVNHSFGDDVTAGYIVATVERLRDPAQRVADRMMELVGSSEALRKPPKRLRFRT
jgi:integrase